LTVEVKLRNHKKEDVTVNVLYNLWGDWQMLENNFPWTKKNARQSEFTVPIAKDAESVLRFRVRLTG
jgi:hypothetical protein